MKDKLLTNFIHDRGMQLQETLCEISLQPDRDPDRNPQTEWIKFKNEIGAYARIRSKVLIPKNEKEIKNLETELEEIVNDPDLTEDEIVLGATILTERLALLHARKHQNNRMSAQVRNRLEGEIIGHYWSMINKARKPRELIQRLIKPGTDPLADADTQYETDSQRMADIARNYHNSIQKQRRDTAPDIRDPTIEVVLQRIVRKKNSRTD